MIRSVCGLALFSLLVLPGWLAVAAPAEAEDARLVALNDLVGFRLELPDTYDAELHVRPNGRADGDGSERRPFGSLSDALRFLAKADSPLAMGRSTRLNVAPGTYSESLAPLTWEGEAGQTLLVIEGKGDGPNDVVLKPTQDHPAGEDYLRLDGKSSLVLRNMAFTESRDGRASGTVGSAKTFVWLPDIPMNDWLIEHCVFRDGEGRGLMLRHVNHLTMRHCKFHDLANTGLAYVGRASLFEDIEITRTNTKSKGGFGTGGSSLLIADCVFRRIHIHDIPWGFGFRQDHGGENILIEDSVFDGFQRAAIRLETAKGPITVRNSIVRNSPIAFYTDAGELTLTNNIIEAEDIALDFQEGQRYNPANCVPPGFGCIGSKVDVGNPGDRVSNELPLFGVEAVTLLNNTITVTGEDARIVKLTSDESFWQDVIPANWHGRNNVFHTPGSDKPFSDLSNKPISFEAWQKLANTDADSFSGDPAKAPAGVGATLYKDPQQNPVRFSRAGLSAAAAAASTSVQIDVPQGQAWEMTTTRDWIRVSPDRGTGPGEVTVELTANPLRTRRGGFVLLDAGNRAWDLMVQQRADALAEPTPPATDLQISDVGERSAVLSWKAPELENLYGFGVNVRPRGGQWAKAPETGASQPRVELTGLQPGMTYDARVITIATDGKSDDDAAVIRFETQGHRDPCQTVLNPDFAADVSGWSKRWGDAEVVHAPDQGHNEPGAMLVQIPDGDNIPALQTNVKAGVSQSGPGAYEVSAWIKVPKGEGKYHLGFMVQDNLPRRTFDISEPTTVSARDGWVQLKTTTTLESVPNIIYLLIVRDKQAPTFLVDDVSMKKVGCGK